MSDQMQRIAKEAAEKGRAATEQSQQMYSTMIENMRELNIKIIDMARHNTEAAFKLAGDLAAAKTPSEMIELWTAHARRQYEALSEQTKELTTLGRNTPK